jgi:serine/threonine protein phosphatase PrpC
VGLNDIDEEDVHSKSTSAMTSASTPFETRRRRRLTKQKEAVQKEKKEKKKKKLVEEDADPYDSDPGESYRQHCLRINGLNTKTCLAVPAFFKNKDIEGDTVMTEPPSPFSSELEDVLNQTPRSLPSSHVVRYSLRTSIGDGSAKQPTGASVMERRELRPNNVEVNVSHWSATGARPYMEDRYVLPAVLFCTFSFLFLDKELTLAMHASLCFFSYAIEDLGAVQVEISPVATRNNQSDEGVEVMHNPGRKNKRVKMPVTWFGIFDGHGGDKASQYCADWLSSYAKNEEAFPHDLGYAMKNAFTAIDDDFVGTGYPDGSTACAVSMVGGRRIVCANAGDSRAIVVRKDGSVVRLSRDHKPGMPDETRRISELGGRVVYWGRWRVEGLLAVSRSVGDASLKPYITAEPEVCEYDVGKDDWFLVMSSDGVWDVLDNEEVAHVIIATACVMKEGKLVIDTDRFKYAARNLCEHAKYVYLKVWKGSHCSITVSHNFFHLCY